MPCFSSMDIVMTDSSVLLSSHLSDIMLVKFLDKKEGLFGQRCSNKSVFLQYIVITLKTKQNLVLIVFIKCN